MSISPFFQSVLGGDLDAEELADDALLPRVISLKTNALKIDDDLVEESARYDRALTALKIVGARAVTFKAKKAAEDVIKRAKLKNDLDLQVAVARTDAKLRRRVVTVG